MIDLLSCDSKLLRSCRKLSWFLRLPYRRSFSIRALRFRSLSKGSEKRRSAACWSGRGFRSFRLTGLCTSRPPEEIDKLGELRSMTEQERFRAPFPSPITPAYVKFARLRSAAGEPDGIIGSLDQIEEARRRMSFGNCLAEMLAEEGKVSSLVDVEELLHHWSNLRSPVFVELVCSFYEQLCNELFVGSEDDDELLRDAI